MKSHIPYRNIALAAIMAGLLWIASYLTLRNLGTLLGGIDDTVGAIFGNLQTAVIRPSALALFITGALFLLLQILCGGKKWIYALSPLFILIGFVGSVLFATVNGVLLSDMLRILIGLAQNGLFDLL